MGGTLERGVETAEGRALVVTYPVEGTLSTTMRAGAVTSPTRYRWRSCLAVDVTRVFPQPVRGLVPICLAGTIL